MSVGYTATFGVFGKTGNSRTAVLGLQHTLLQVAVRERRGRIGLQGPDELRRVAGMRAQDCQDLLFGLLGFGGGVFGGYGSDVSIPVTRARG